MSVPEPKPEPASESKIVSIRPDVLAEGQRVLAAIVFTDTVDFSALMSKDEDRARRLVSRDLGSMRLACARFDGEVLKSTGDGLLMLFTSAVQAVACALEIQAKFREQNHSLPMAERLRHRIGIHLGDVIRQHDDVMGDGVNIASRIQAEGAPGGVCISSTVYEVVQNRLPFYVASRKTKKLKNVGSVIVYHIAQRTGGYRYLNQAWDWVLIKKKRLIKLAAVVFALTVAGYFSTEEVKPYHDELQEAAYQLNPLGSVSPLAAADDDDDNDDNDSVFAHADRRSRPGTTAASDEDFYIARFNNMKRYDFDAMRAWLQTHDSPGVDSAKLVRVLDSMHQLFDWCYSSLSAYSSLHPLVVRTESEDLELWPAPAGGLNWKIHGNASIMSRDQVPPGVMAEMAVQLIHDNAPSGAASTRQLWLGLENFIATYRVLSERLRKQVDAGARTRVR